MSGNVRVTCVFVQEFVEFMGTYQCTAELPQGSTVKDLIEYIERNVKKGFRGLILDENGRLRWPNEIAVNGRRIEFLEGLDTKLKNGDRVLFSPRALFVL